MLAISFFVSVLTLIIYGLFKPFRKSIKNVVQDFCNGFFCNGAIHSLQVTYLNHCFGVSNQMMLLIKGSDALSTDTMWTSLVTGLGLIAIIVFISILIYKRKEDFGTHQSINNYGGLYSGINLNINKYSIYFFSAFLIRRFIFSEIPVLFNHQVL